MATKDKSHLIDAHKYKLDESFTDDTKEEYWNSASIGSTIHNVLKKDLFKNSRSKEHFDSMLPYYYEESAKIRQLEDSGIGTQFLLGGLAELTNAPLYIGATLLAPATATFFGSRVLLRAGIGAASGLALEATKDVVGEQDKTTVDYLSAMMFDASLNAIIGSKTRTMNDILETNLARTLNITKEVKDKLSKAKTKEEKQSIIKESYQGKESKSLLDTIDNYIETSERSIVKEGWENFRFDIAHVTGKSNSPMFSAFARDMFPDPALREQGRTHLVEERDFIEEQMRRYEMDLFGEDTVNFAQELNSIFVKPSAESVNQYSRLLSEIQIQKQLNAYNGVEEPVEYIIDKILKGAEYAKFNSKNIRDILLSGSKKMEDMAISYHARLGIAGHKDFTTDGGTKAPSIPQNKNYIPFVLNKNKLGEYLLDGITEPQIVKFFSSAINSGRAKRGLSPLGDEYLKAMSLAYYRALTSADTASMTTTSSIMKSIMDDPALSMKVKKEMFPERFKQDEGVGTLGRERTTIDYDYSMGFISKNGKRINMNMKDFINKDYFGAMEQYRRKMSSATALGKHSFTRKAIKPQEIDIDEAFDAQAKAGALDNARVTTPDGTERLLTPKELDIAKRELRAAIKKEMTIDEAEVKIDSQANLAHFVKQIEEELAQAVKSGNMTTKDRDKELARLKMILNDMQGLPTTKDPFSNALRAYRVGHTYNISRLLGQTHFTMAGEMSSVIWDLGIKGFMETMPQVKALLKSYRTGKIDDELANELETWMALSTDYYKNIGVYRHDHEFNAIDGLTTENWNKAVQQIESKGEIFAEATLMIGLIKPLTTLMQHSLALGTIRKIMKASQGKLDIDDNFKKMIKEIGLNDEGYAQVLDQFKKHSSSKSVGFENWDRNIRDMFIIGMRRRNDSIVQKSRLGDRPAFASEKDYLLADTVMGKVVFELKDYIMTAYTKQLGRNLSRGDAHIMGLVMVQAASLALSYLAKTYVNYGHDEEKLKELTTATAVASNTMQMLPSSSILPMILNTTGRLTTGEPVIGKDLHSGVITGGVSSLPTVDLLNRLMKVIPTLYEGIHPEETISGSQMKSAFGILPLSNSTLIRPMMESVKTNMDK